MAEGTCTIGRIGVATAGGGDGDTIFEPSDITQTGSSINLSGLQTESSISKIQWRRDQFLGLVDPGAERVIPCTFSAYAQLDGFYRLENVSADRIGSGVAWSLDLTRIQSWGHPRVEIVTSSGLLTNSHGVTSGSIVYVPPGTPTSWAPYGNTFYTARPNADGFNHVTVAADGVSAAATGRSYMQVKPSEWYKGGCRAQLNLDSGGTYYTIIGRKSFVDPIDLARLRISNGLVRVTGPGATLSPQWWDGSQWESTSNISLSDVTYGAISTGTGGFQILRNAPEEVAVRIPGYFALGSSTNYPVWIDLSIRRGVRVLTGYIYSIGGAQWRISLGSAPAQTSIAGGLRDTSNNADGNRYLLVTNNATTIDTGNKRVSQASALNTMLFGFSVELAGSSATTGDTATVQAGEFFMPGSDTAIVTAL